MEQGEPVYMQKASVPSNGENLMNRQLTLTKRSTSILRLKMRGCVICDIPTDNCDNCDNCDIPTNATQ